MWRDSANVPFSLLILNVSLLNSHITLFTSSCCGINVGCAFTALDRSHPISVQNTILEAGKYFLNFLSASLSVPIEDNRAIIDLKFKIL